MTYKTHREFGIGWVILGNVALYELGVTEVNYYLALIVMLAIGRYGALFPDVDHEWCNVKEKTIVNWFINKSIHLTGGKHRSWQTHSIDIATVMSCISYILPKYLYEIGRMSKVNSEVLSCLAIGFCLGWLSHLFSDMLTSAGVRLFFWSKKKYSFVPKQLLGIRFNTGNEWENWVYKVSRIVNVILLITGLAYPVIIQYIGKV